MTEKLAVFDIDNTLSKKFLIAPIMRAEHEKGLLLKSSYEQAVELLTAAANGDIEYEVAAQALLNTHARGLAGRRVVELEQHAHEFLQQHTELFRAFGERVLTVLRAEYELVAVTAEPAYMAGAVSQTLGLDRVISSQYEAEEGVFTGEVSVSLAHRDQKREFVEPLRPVFGFGDSAGDIEMLRHSRFAYCISPDSALASEAAKHDWLVFEGDSDASKIVDSVRSRL